MSSLRPFAIVCVLSSLFMSGCSEPHGSADPHRGDETSAGGDTLVSVMTFNIRYDNPSDGIDSWEKRSRWVGSLIDSSGAAVVGLQEALRHQIDQIVEVAPRFSWVGVGRDDGKDAGEFSPILYDSAQVRLLDWQSRWLSEAPDSIGSVGWDASMTRIATLATFFVIGSGDTLRVVNAHFDHLGEIAREESARMVAHWSSKSSIVMGDFNFEPNSNPYRVITTEKQLKDTAPEFGEGLIGTFRTFDPLSDTSRRIDYVFHGPGIEVLSYEVLSPIRNGRFPSDHLPVIAEIRVK